MVENNGDGVEGDDKNGGKRFFRALIDDHVFHRNCYVIITAILSPYGCVICGILTAVLSMILFQLCYLWYFYSRVICDLITAVLSVIFL